MNKKSWDKWAKGIPVGNRKDQAWFWTPRWQKMEKEADEEIRKGKVKKFNSWESTLEYLDVLKKSNK